MPSSPVGDRFYRLYALSEVGAIIGAQSRPFASDEEALGHAAALLNLHHGVELWQTHRLVGRLEQGAVKRGERMRPAGTASPA